MNEVNKEAVGLGLRVVCTVTTGLFTGGAMYINLVEAPARATHDPPSAVTMWRPSYVRAKSLLSKLAVISGVGAVGAYMCTCGKEKNIEWLVAGGLMLSIPPFTIIFIAPVNNQLMETEKCISVKGDKWIEETLRSWNSLHSARTLMALGAFSVMVYTLSRK